MARIQLAVLRYIRDPVRDEPRNVGVIAWADGKAVGRFLGEDTSGGLDLRRVSTGIIADRQTYADWIRHLKGLISGGEVDDPVLRRRIDTADPGFLESVAVTVRGNYDLRLGAEAYTEASSLESVLNQAFQRLVDEHATGGGGALLPEGTTAEAVAVTSHRELAYSAYLELKRNRFEEQRDFVRHYQVFGKTQKGAEVPAVFDFGVVPASSEGGLFPPSGGKLLIDAISLNVAEDESPMVIDRARAIASKAVEIRKSDESVDVRALISNGTSRETQLGRYALSVLRDEGDLAPLDLPQMMDLVSAFKKGRF